MLKTRNSGRKFETREIRNIGSRIRDILILLPSLCHLEHGLSTHWQQELASIKTQTFTDVEMNVLPHYEDSVKTRYQALNLGFGIVLNSAPGTVTSLKLKDTMVWINPGTAMVPVSLQHLDLEIKAGREGLWRRRLRELKQFRTLRLKTMHGGGRCTEYQKGKPRVSHTDDLFVDPYDAKDRCFFPELESLALLDCALRLNGLFTIMRKHQHTLKELNLDRVTLFPSYDEVHWRQIGEHVQRRRAWPYVPPPHQTGHVPLQTFR